MLVFSSESKPLIKLGHQPTIYHSGWFTIQLQYNRLSVNTVFYLIELALPVLLCGPIWVTILHQTSLGVRERGGRGGGVKTHPFTCDTVSLLLLFAGYHIAYIIMFWCVAIDASVWWLVSSEKEILMHAINMIKVKCDCFQAFLSNPGDIQYTCNTITYFSGFLIHSNFSFCNIKQI